MGKGEVAVSERDELVVSLKVFSFTREYLIPLERTELSNEDKLLHENEEMKKELQKTSISL